MIYLIFSSNNTDLQQKLENLVGYALQQYKNNIEHKEQKKTKITVTK